MQIVFQPFDELKVSTQTWVVYTNIEIDNECLFNAIECAPIESNRPASQRMMVFSNENIEDGAIVFIEYNKNRKGTSFKVPTNKEMRNCSTIIMKMHDRYHNIKISRGGSIQMTGIKHENYARDIVSAIWKLILNVENCWHFQPLHDKFLGYIMCRMYNVSFSLGPYHVDLEKLNYTVKMEVNEKKSSHENCIEYTSTYEPSVGHVGPNIKVNSSKQDMANSRIIKVTNSSKNCAELSFTSTTFKEFTEKLPRKPRSKKVNANYQNSFLVFSTGRIIMSGKISEENRRDSYEKFCQLIRTYGHKFLMQKT